MKRFQLLTKTPDPGIGRAYLGLSELDESLDILDEGSGEALPDDEGKGGKVVRGGKKAVREEGNREERALERFFGDEEWEGEVGAPERRREGKWKMVGNERRVVLGGMKA